MGVAPSQQQTSGEELSKLAREASLPTRGATSAAPAIGSSPSGAYGIQSLQFPVELLKPIQDVFLRVEAARGKRLRDWFEPLNCFHVAASVSVPPYSFEVTDAGITISMSWVWPKDEETLSLFQPIFEAAVQAGLRSGPAASGPLQLWTATILVRRSTSLDEQETEFHTDYWHDDVPPGFAFSLLTPLFEMTEGTGGLEYYPWTKPYDPDSADPDWDAQRYQRYSYRLGHMVAVDGKCLHRTEPYALEESRLRVLLSLDVHPASPTVAFSGARASVRAQHDGGAYTRAGAASSDEGDDDSFRDDELSDACSQESD